MGKPYAEEIALLCPDEDFLAGRNGTNQNALINGSQRLLTSFIWK
jgi:hypothetical protein